MTKKLKVKGKPVADDATIPALSIYQIDAEMTIIRSLLEGGDGELTPEQDAYYANLLEMAKKKADGYISTIQFMESQAEAAKAIVKAATAKVKRWESIAESLRDRLCTFMGNQSIPVIRPENPTLPSVYWNAGRPKLEIDAKLLPPEYTKPEPKPDREAIDKGIAEGKDIPGVVKTVGSDYLTIR